MKRTGFFITLSENEKSKLIAISEIAEISMVAFIRMKINESYQEMKEEQTKIQ